ncbi:MAG: O-antigen ligase family protein [Methylophaga sp.]|nr:O-antigen ligase family protein [Methylophaga sp.]
MLARNYFSFSVLVFLAAFVILPSSKLVNSFYYLFIALPGLVYLAVHFKVLRPTGALEYLWLAFIGYCLIFGLVNDTKFAKYALYVFVFVGVVARLVAAEWFNQSIFARAMFWSLLGYVIISAIWYGLTGSYQYGDRIVELPQRLYGPIFTSILICSSLVLVGPVWFRERAIFEALIGLAVAVFCVVVILQSRTGIVGLLLWALLVWCLLVYKNIRRVRVLGLLAIVPVVGLVLIAVNADALVPLWQRADAGRFEIWQYYLSGWQSCGLLAGCGLDFEMSRQIKGQTILHAHSIFIALGVHLGLVPLLLFTSMMLVGLYLAVKQKNWWGGFLAMALLLCNLDGNMVIASPNELWLLVWLPLALIMNTACQQRGAV